MNLFEDLIDELKEENLLEETVISSQKGQSGALRPPVASLEANGLAAAPVDLSEDFAPALAVPKTESETATARSVPADFGRTAFGVAAPDNGFQPLKKELRVEPPVPKRAEQDNEFYRKRAVDEVSGLHMVELVLSSVERQQKSAAKPFDELRVKKALHVFLQVSQEAKAGDLAKAEFELMQETETWYASLSERDNSIEVGDLRRFCETTKPALSSQALISLARFYRNSPFSESVRTKFDLILTRLFTRETDGEKREALFSREELTLQISELYAGWSTAQLYASAAHDSELHIMTVKLDDFVAEAEASASFEDLVSSDFFNRLVRFKESTQENFFAPPVAAAAIEANVRIGNRSVELLRKEEAGSTPADILEKYEVIYSLTASDAIGKTLRLTSVTEEKETKTKKKKPAEIVEVAARAHQPNMIKTEKKGSKSLFAVNKWLLVLTIISLIGTFGIYVWAEYYAQDSSVSTNKVKKVNLDNSSLKEYVQNASISSETFYAVTTPEWDSLNEEKKEELLIKIMSLGPETGFKKIHILTTEGKAVGFASPDKVEVYYP